MARMTDIKIIFDLEPIVKLECIAIGCKHNSHVNTGCYCNLKHVTIDQKRQCEQFDLREKTQGDTK